MWYFYLSAKLCKDLYIKIMVLFHLYVFQLLFLSAGFENVNYFFLQ